MELYNLAAKCLPDYARLKFDRGDALFIARIAPDDVESARQSLANNGFLTTVAKGLLTVTPSSGIIYETTARVLTDEPRDALYRQLKRFSEQDVCPDEIALFIRALKPFYKSDIEFRLRRQAAVCQRSNCGGLLHIIRAVSNCEYKTINDKEVTQ